MKPKTINDSRQRLVSVTIAITLLVTLTGCSEKDTTEVPTAPAKVESAINCPIGFGWSEGLGDYLKPNATMSTDDTATLPTPDCAFHQWSWETFVWATSLDENDTPRFMKMATPADLLSETPSIAEPKPRLLTLASRAHATQQIEGMIEGAGAIVEADGNMLVAQNGYPVYASVHMNQSYFNTAKANLIINDGYTNNTSDHFKVGAAVFKATWLRLGNGVSAPEGAFVTKAQVPLLQVLQTKTNASVVTIKGAYETVDVALVGMHVVGQTENHPEFLWATFEHKLNAPMVADNTFTPSGSNPNDFTFYKASTPFSEVNQTNRDPKNPVLSFDSTTSTFSPPTNVVQQNASGGENQPNGTANIAAVNTSSQDYLRSLKNPLQATFANYNLIGTVWMKPNSYNLKSDSQDAVGSVTLANSTAETFFQVSRNTPMSQVKNCFSCHNAGSYTFGKNPKNLKDRTIALSHVLGEGTSYAVPNSIPIVIPKEQ